MNYVAEKLGVRSLRRLLLAELIPWTWHYLGLLRPLGSMRPLTPPPAQAHNRHVCWRSWYPFRTGEKCWRCIRIRSCVFTGQNQVWHLVYTFSRNGWMAGSRSLLLQRLNLKPQDLYAISRIGQDSKLYKPFSIGRFGLGFYCVYHFTDIPGFVSGENIVIFDPHAFDLPGISPSPPYEEDIFLNNISFLHNVSRYAPYLEVHHLILNRRSRKWKSASYY